MQDKLEQKILWRRIFEEIRAKIQRGEFDSSQKLPSEAGLMRQYGVSRYTAGRVMMELKHELLIERRKGSGSYLTPTARNATGRIGVLMPGFTDVEIMKPIAEGVRESASSLGYEVLFETIDSIDSNVRAAKGRECAMRFVAKKVAGVILEPLELIHNSFILTREIIDILRSHGIHVTLIDRDAAKPPDRSDVDLVGLNNYRCGQRIAEHILSAGAKRILFLMLPTSAPTIHERAAGVVATAAIAGVEAFVKAEYPEDIDAMRVILKGKKAPDAVICGNDVTAVNLLKTLSKLGLKVPKDVLLAGFDDVKAAAAAHPPLTSMRQPCKVIGNVAVRLLVMRMHYPDEIPREVCCDATLVVRASTIRK